MGNGPKCHFDSVENVLQGKGNKGNNPTRHQSEGIHQAQSESVQETGSGGRLTRISSRR